jgi:hypothetical protein
MAGSHAWIAFPSDKFQAESHPDNIKKFSSYFAKNNLFPLRRQAYW